MKKFPLPPCGGGRSILIPLRRWGSLSSSPCRLSRNPLGDRSRTRLGTAFQEEPEEIIAAQAEEIGMVADRRELLVTNQLDRHAAPIAGEVEFDRLGMLREVVDAQQGLGLGLADEGQD